MKYEELSGLLGEYPSSKNDVSKIEYEFGILGLSGAKINEEEFFGDLLTVNRHTELLKIVKNGEEMFVININKIETIELF